MRVNVANEFRSPLWARITSDAVSLPINSTTLLRDWTTDGCDALARKCSLELVGQSVATASVAMRKNSTGLACPRAGEASGLIGTTDGFDDLPCEVDYTFVANPG